MKKIAASLALVVSVSVLSGCNEDEKIMKFAETLEDCKGISDIEKRKSCESMLAARYAEITKAAKNTKDCKVIKDQKFADDCWEKMMLRPADMPALKALLNESSNKKP